MTDRELQSLRNLGGLSEEAADEIVRLRAALEYAISEADEWRDDSRGSPIDDTRMDAARALLRQEKQ